MHEPQAPEPEHYDPPPGTPPPVFDPPPEREEPAPAYEPPPAPPAYEPPAPVPEPPAPAYEPPPSHEWYTPVEEHPVEATQEYTPVETAPYEVAPSEEPAEKWSAPSQVYADDTEVVAESPAVPDMYRPEDYTAEGVVRTRRRPGRPTAVGRLVSLIVSVGLAWAIALALVAFVLRVALGRG